MRYTVWNWPGTLPRLPMHIGAFEACQDFGIPLPDEVFSQSAGAMAISAIAGCNAIATRKAANVIGNLTPEQIFRFPTRIKMSVGSLGIASFGLAGLLLLDDKLTRKQKMLLAGGGLGALLTAEAVLGRELLHSPALFSIAPLLNLLERTLDPKSILASPMLINVLATDIERPALVSYSNMDSELQNLSEKEFLRQWVRLLHGSARLPGKFEAVKVKGITLLDAEAWTDFPISLMEHSPYIVRFDYWEPLRTARAPMEWIPDLTRSFDIMRDRCTQLTFENYAYRRKLAPELPEVFCIRASPQLFSEIQEIMIHKFTPADMKHLMDVGYRIVKENVPALKKYLRIR